MVILLPLKTTLALALISTTSALTEEQTTDVDYAVQNRQRIIQEVNTNTSSTWQAGQYERFAGQSYERFLRDGAGVLGGDPTENAAGLITKLLSDIQAKSGILLSDIPAEFNTYMKWGNVCPIMAKIQGRWGTGVQKEISKRAYSHTFYTYLRFFYTVLLLLQTSPRVAAVTPYPPLRRPRIAFALPIMGHNHLACLRWISCRAASRARVRTVVVLVNKHGSSSDVVKC
jgi:hypothetical protein